MEAEYVEPPPNQATVTAEFMRRLQHQLELWRVHAYSCTLEGEDVPCWVGTLIARGIGDSWTTLKGLGWQREADSMITRVMSVRPGHGDEPGEGGQ